MLGPVEAYAGGQRVDLGPRRGRYVLSVLALHVGQAVSVGRLIELAWPGDPPRTATHAIAVLVSQLRTVIAAAGGGPHIVRQGRGYVLRADPLSIDAHRFRALAEQARRTADDARAAELLERALGLWRGEPAACCSPDGESGLWLALGEARLTATEDLIEARLRLGQHRDVLGGLSELVARHGLRERLAGQLMLALHRDGRTSDALGVYAAIRQRLATELGLDPGQQLQRLHGDLLRDAPGSAAPAPVAPPPAVAGVRVVLVDDHPLFRAGMRIALETGTEVTVVGEADDAESAVRLVEAMAPAVVVMDMCLPGASGAAATRELAARHPALAILMMTMSAAEADILEALRAGARGYVLKSAGREEVLSAIRTVAHGGSVFSAEVAARLTVLASGDPEAR